MPKKFDDMVNAIKVTLKKDNPKMDEKTLSSKAFAMATAQWKKMHGKAPSREALKDWRVLEFFVPIDEKVFDEATDDFIIRGVAINETTTLNNVKYVADELEKASSSFRNVPLLLDHKNEVKNIVGRTTPNVNFNSVDKRIDFEAKVMDKDIRQMIKDGRIQNVSIGAKVDDLVEEIDGSKKAVGIRGLEISLVAVPGDSQANLAQAIDYGFHLKEMAMEPDEEYDEEEKDEDEEIENKEEKINSSLEQTELNKNMEKQMTEETKEIATPIVAPVAESAVVSEQRKELDELKAILADKKKVQEELKALESKKDETKGEIPKEKVEVEKSDDIVVERADNGRGFSLYGSYESNPKLKRLSRK